MSADLAVIGNHDHLIASVLIFGGLGWAVLATLVVAFFKGANRPAPRRLPGALGDSVRGEDDYYERLRTPGMGDARVVPFRSETRDRIAALIAEGQARQIDAEWRAQSEDER